MISPILTAQKCAVRVVSHHDLLGGVLLPVGGVPITTPVQRFRESLSLQRFSSGMRFISLVKLFSWADMSAREVSANTTSVFVVHQPAGEHHRSVVQITIRPGKRQSDEVHLALQRVLEGVQTLKRLAEE